MEPRSCLPFLRNPRPEYFLKWIPLRPCEDGVGAKGSWSGYWSQGERIGSEMSEATGVYVLDTSAWLTLIEDEAGTEIVQALLKKAGAGEVTVLVSFMSFMEVYYIALQERDAKEAQERVDLMAALPSCPSSPPRRWVSWLLS